MNESRLPPSGTSGNPSGPLVQIQIQSLSPQMPGDPSGEHFPPTPAPAPAPMKVSLVTPIGPPPLSSTPTEVRQGSFLLAAWRKIGGGSLMASLMIHVAILLTAALMVSTMVIPEKKVDFLPGGGSKAGQEASQQLAQQVRVKKRSLLARSTPLSKVVSTSTTAAIALQDLPADTMDMPELSSIMGGGTMGSSGFGSGGAGGGFGEGMGIGGASGATFKPIIMFGQNLKARKIAVIMDVSGSMTPHLTKVIKELDRVAAGSTVILYVGCGVAKPEKGVRLDDDAFATRSSTKIEERSFEVFWRRSHKAAPQPDPPDEPKKKKKTDEADPVPENDVYQVLANRNETYFIKSQGIKYAWLSLLAREVRHADALYWFADFQDEVDEEQMEAVLKNLKRRQQKLFIHASGKGKSFESVRDQLALPSGGEVVKGK